ncbi:hypothetical protein C1646_775865 [Rhizophagus diaphanus]|nr:hypothetical protein C1646_775865 [Rhizophagus diaphanus] [Rhizophagus sp. MUCL 43196]
MSKSHITPGKLVATGSIIPELHYGLEVMIQFNNNPFIIRIVYKVHSFLQPGYICEGKGQSSSINTSTSAAITSVYQSVFSSKTKYAGLSYLENITVFVSCLGKITISNSDKVGHNYAASLFHKYRRAQSVFYQHVHKDFFLITIYQNSQIIAEYKDISPNALYLKRNIRRSVEWRQVFQNWIQQKSNIIEIYDHFSKIYDVDYEFQEREMRVWHMMLRIIECTDITPYNKDVSCNEFWTNASEPEKNHETIAKLYADGLLNVTFPTRTFWNCFRNGYNANSKEADGKTRILSIIAEKFTYREIIEKLEISPNSVNIVRKHLRINGPGCSALEKPVIVYSKMSEVKEKEFQLFFADKANVNMSFYKMDAKIQLSVLYLKDQKSALWKKFSATYPDGMKHTSFMSRLECMQQHFSRCQECDKIFTIFKDLTDQLDAIHHPKLLEYQEQLICYLAHQTCKAYLNAQFNSILCELDDNGAIIVVNYKMQILLATARETKSKFFGKHGWTLHTTLVFRKNKENYEELDV